MTGRVSPPVLTLDQLKVAVTCTSTLTAGCDQDATLGEPTSSDTRLSSVDRVSSRLLQQILT